MVKDNAFPDNVPKFTEFGIDFQLPFEVEIDHKYFQSIFGVNSEPRKRDFLYFPLLNRMFEIQGSYLHRGFMMAPTFWKIQLKKYNPNIDMLLTDDTRTFLDNVILSAENLFGDEVTKDIKDGTMPEQYKKITTTFDSSRKSLHPDLIQRPLKYTYNFCPLIENYYDLGAILPSDLTVDLTNDSPVISTTQQVFNLPNLDNVPTSPNEVILAYQDSYLYLTWKNGALMTNDKNVSGLTTRYVRVRGPFDSIANHIGENDEGRYIRIEAYRDTSLNVQKNILYNNSGPVPTAQFKIRDTAVVYNAQPKFDAVSNRNLSFTCLFNVPSSADTINFIDGYDNVDSKGIRITSAFTRYNSTQPEGDLVITVLVNSVIKTYTINNFVSEVWHAMVISMSNEFLQCGAYVYRIKEDPSDLVNHNDFIRLLSNTSSFTQQTFDLTQNYTLPSSKILITNIRVFNTMLREEEHDFILSQQFLKDESMLVLIDNCRPQTNLPYIAKNR